MPGAPFWVGGPSSLAFSWDELSLVTQAGMITLPGVARVWVKIKADIHKGKAQGTDSPAVTDRGLTPKKVYAELKIYTLEQWELFQAAIVPFITPGIPRGAITIVHPQADAAGIGTVVLENLEIPAPSAKDPMIVKMEFTELKPPKPVVTLPAAKIFSQVGLTPLPGSNGT